MNNILNKVEELKELIIDTDEYKNIMIEFDGNRPKNTAAIKFGDKAFSIGYEYIFIIVIVLAIVIALAVVYVKNKKNNVV